VQNTYFTLPVLFIMISNHYPITYSGPYGWLVLPVISIAGVLVRRFYVLTHFRTFAYSLLAAAAVVAGRYCVRHRAAFDGRRRTRRELRAGCADRGRALRRLPRGAPT